MYNICKIRCICARNNIKKCHISRRCVNCSLLIVLKVKRALNELNEQMTTILGSWITPTPLSPDDVLCEECFILLQERIFSNESQIQKDISPAYGHLHVCVGCGSSIARSKYGVHSVPIDCPQRTIILKWTPSHRVDNLETVCKSCWMAATREIQRQNREDSSIYIVNIHDSPPLSPEVPPQQMPEVPKIHSSRYKRVSATARHCIFVGCNSTGRVLVPSSIKEELLLQYNVYIPLISRICRYHLSSKRWDELDAPYTDFTGFQVDNIFHLLEKASKRQL